jgi:hypothetical protein
MIVICLYECMFLFLVFFIDSILGVRQIIVLVLPGTIVRLMKHN